MSPQATAVPSRRSTPTVTRRLANPVVPTGTSRGASLRRAVETRNLRPASADVGPGRAVVPSRAASASAVAARGQRATAGRGADAGGRPQVAFSRSKRSRFERTTGCDFTQSDPSGTSPIGRPALLKTMNDPLARIARGLRLAKDHIGRLDDDQVADRFVVPHHPGVQPWLARALGEARLGHDRSDVDALVGQVESVRPALQVW